MLSPPSQPALSGALDGSSSPLNFVLPHKRHLPELVAEWYAFHGQTLSQPHQLINKLKVICYALEDPVVNSFQPADFAKYRETRLNGTVKDACYPLLNQERSTLNKATFLQFLEP